MVILDLAVQPNHQFASVDDFIESTELPTGHIRINTGSTPIDFKYIPRGSKNLAAFFTAAVPKDSLAPRFTGFGIGNGLDADCLHFADPSLVLTPELFLAWYTGHKNLLFQNIMPRILSKFANHHEGRTVMYGGSAGGFAALYNGLFVESSIAIAANPQTNLKFYNRALVARWLKTCWDWSGSVDDGLEQVEASTDLVISYRHHHNGNQKSIILQNSQDTSHVGPHYLPFVESHKESGTLLTYQGNWGEGHKAPPKEIITQTLNMSLHMPWTSGDWADRGYERH